MGGDCLRPARCSWYCPISENRKIPNAHYADELHIEDPSKLGNVIDKLVYEAKMIDAGGMSLTGGDPLSTPRKVNWAVSVIAGMKIKMGDNFHIHLYTCGSTFGKETAKKLNNAGLDALRFHPSKEDFPKIEYAMGMNYKVGAEVPVIPTPENHQYLMELGDYLEMIGADYLNLNEFEMVSTNQRALQELGFTLKTDSIAAVPDSFEYSLKFFDDFGEGSALNIHYCTSSLKDGVQLRNRYIRRAKNIKRDLEELTLDGTLLFLRIKGGIQTIKALERDLIEESGVPQNLIEVLPSQGRLDLPPFLFEDESFIDMLRDYDVKGGLVEIMPFREDEGAYQELEYTPIKDN